MTNPVYIGDNKSGQVVDSAFGTGRLATNDLYAYEGGQ